LRALTIAVCASAIVFIGGAVLQLVDRIASVLALFFGGWLIASALEPGVSWLSRHSRLRRQSAIVATYLAILAILLLAWTALSASFSGASSGLRPGIDALQLRAIQLEEAVNLWLAERGLSIHLDVGSSLNPDSLARQALAQVVAAPWDALAFASSATGAFAGIGLMLLLSVYFLTGGPQLAELLLGLFPERMDDEARFILCTINDAFGGFFRSQAAQAVIFGGGTWVCLALAHVEAAPIAAVAAGLLLLIPMVGAPLAMVPPLLAMLIWQPSASVTVFVVVILAVFQALVLNVLGPRLVGRQLGLPPLLVLFGILIGAQLGGLWGAVLGVPTLSAAMTTLTHFRGKAGARASAPGQ